MEEKPLVSVVIATYNNGRYIEEAIQSVLRQTYDRYEMIVVDDGSNDETEKILIPYLDKIRYFKNDHKGCAFARNTGVRASTGSYISFLDADDIWMPERVKILVKYLNENQNVAVCFHDVASFDKEGEFLKTLKKQFQIFEGSIFNELLLNNFVMNIATMIRKEIFSDVGLFDEEMKLVSDYNLYLRISYSHRYGFIDKVLGKRRCHENNLSRSISESYQYNLLNMDKIRSLYPDVVQEPVWKETEYKFHKHFALAFFEYGKYFEARSEYKHLIGKNPFNWKDFVRLLLCYFPFLAENYKKLRKKRHRGF